MGEFGIQAYDSLLKDDSVKRSVKLLLEAEYQPGSQLFSIFVEHSSAVASLAMVLGQSCGARLDFLREAAWLHDIGIKYTHAPGICCLGKDPYLRHGVIGRELCDKFELPEHGLVCERHVGTGLTKAEIEKQGLPLPARDMLCQTLEERLICYADNFFSKKGLSRLELGVVRQRIHRHGELSLERFEDFHQEFGAFLPLIST